jgi:hypothetical protein
LHSRTTARFLLPTYHCIKFTASAVGVICGMRSGHKGDLEMRPSASFQVPLPRARQYSVISSDNKFLRQVIEYSAGQTSVPTFLSSSMAVSRQINPCHMAQLKCRGRVTQIRTSKWRVLGGSISRRSLCQEQYAWL